MLDRQAFWRRVLGPTAIIDDGETGWLVEPDDEEALVAALVDVAPGGSG